MVCSDHLVVRYVDLILDCLFCPRAAAAATALVRILNDIGPANIHVAKITHSRSSAPVPPIRNLIHWVQLEENPNRLRFFIINVSYFVSWVDHNQIDPVRIHCSISIFENGASLLDLIHFTS